MTCEEETDQPADEAPSDDGFAQPIFVKNALEQYWDDLDRRLSGTNKTGLITGLAELDEILGGCHNSELIVIAGRPAMGKTTFSMHIAHNMAVAMGKPACVFSYETSVTSAIKHLLSAHAGIDRGKVFRSVFTKEDVQKLAQATEKLVESPLWISGDGHLPLSKLSANIRFMHAKNSIEVAIIDCLQMIALSPSERKPSRAEEIEEIMRVLRQLSSELHIPIIVTSQLSKKAEKRKSPSPILSDLYSSDVIEGYADIVMLLHRPEYYRADDRPGEMEVIIAKNRYGPTGTVNLQFDGTIGKVDNLTIHPDNWSPLM